MSQASEPIALSNPDGFALTWQTDSRFGPREWRAVVPLDCPRCSEPLEALQAINASVTAKYECGDTYYTQGGMQDSRVKGVMKDKRDGR